jgi:hypothetical protein
VVVQVVKESDLGDNDTSYRVLTHLGHLLTSGDTVLGYDLRHAVGLEGAVDELPFACPDVMLVRKTYPDKTGTKGRGKAGRSNAGRKGRGKKHQKPVEEETADTETETQVQGERVDAPVASREAPLVSWVPVEEDEYDLYMQQIHDEDMASI